MFRLPQSKHIANDNVDEWEVIAEYATNHQQAMDAHDIVDDIYRHAEYLMHESCMVMQPVYVGKLEDLYLWCFIWESYSCRCDTGIRITEKNQTLSLKQLEYMIDTATQRARCTLASPRMELVGFLAQRAKDLQMTNLVGEAPLIIPFHRSDITVSSR
jgi:hypothetical protein